MTDIVHILLVQIGQPAVTTGQHPALTIHIGLIMVRKVSLSWCIIWTELSPCDIIMSDSIAWRLQVTMQTNYHGPMALMQLLMPKLKESTPSRVVWTSSGLESIGSLPDLNNPEALE